MTGAARRQLIQRLEAARLALAPHVVDRLGDYLNLLARWNRQINLTGLPLDPPSDQAIDRLIVEPLSAISWVDEGPLGWFDFGSGGGSPAVPIKLTRPQARLTMVESRGRKASFLREAIRQLELPRATVFEGRYQTVPATSGMTGSARLVTSRAVKTDSDLLDAAGALLVSGGRLLIFGRDGDVPPRCGFVVTAAPPGLAVLSRK